MKSYLKVALVAILALLPCTSSFAALSADVSTAVTALATATDKVAAKKALASAIYTQITADGPNSISAISAELILLATDADSATEITQALAFAAFEYSGEAGMADVGTGLSASGAEFSQDGLDVVNDITSSLAVAQAINNLINNNARDISASTGIGD
ncbi:MAG: hypothetical protein WC360_01450 [Opitutales bacterium]|jgi:hypothetical protein